MFGFYSDPACKSRRAIKPKTNKEEGMKKIILAVAAIVAVFASSASWAQVHVRGYYRGNGTYVQPHIRSYPDGNPYNNYGPQSKLELDVKSPISPVSFSPLGQIG